MADFISMETISDAGKIAKLLICRLVELKVGCG